MELPYAKSSGTHEYLLSSLDKLEDYIQTVLDASIPNKAQNRAASKMAAGYFQRARNEVAELVIKV